jgi:hypothetical protein
MSVISHSDVVLYLHSPSSIGVTVGDWNRTLQWSPVVLDAPTVTAADLSLSVLLNTSITDLLPILGNFPGHGGAEAGMALAIDLDAGSHGSGDGRKGESDDGTEGMHVEGQEQCKD